MSARNRISRCWANRGRRLDVRGRADRSQSPGCRCHDLRKNPQLTSQRVLQSATARRPSRPSTSIGHPRCLRPLGSEGPGVGLSNLAWPVPCWTRRRPVGASQGTPPQKKGPDPAFGPVRDLLDRAASQPDPAAASTPGTVRSNAALARRVDRERALFAVCSASSQVLFPPRQPRPVGVIRLSDKAITPTGPPR